MIDPVILVLTLVMVGQVLLSVPVLLGKVKHLPVNLPLALFLLACGVLAMVPIVRIQFLEEYQVFSALAFPTFLLLCPCLWLYVEGITSHQRWKPNRGHSRHFALLLPGLLVSAMMLFLSKEEHTALFIDDLDATTLIGIVVSISLLVIMVLWLGQCIYTTYLIARRLILYKKRLKDTFSNHEGKELNWLLFIAGSIWLLILSTAFYSNIMNSLLFNVRAEAVLSLLLIWSAAHYGLQQKSGLLEYEEESDRELCQGEDRLECNERAEAIKVNKIALAERENKKYQRSALSVEQANRIAIKMNEVMKTEALYLDSTLSLQKLSRHLTISPNYISQTLNETLSTNFFDFINQWRIEAAKPKILENKSTILEVALEVGFNARSSFYKAFKQEVGLSPREFRKQHCSSLKASK
ncbi:helix-turn-helix domain-containing protein [Pseudoalteromonas aurantia]|uniref:HTH araC/xylS-type domain-containing protein n=1 Tax=Pseudoalteromonas aurantia 208 TaxID=1314867 RepID=A0ABR9E5Y4_9GAMM|nr:AraC family transcriptional regulator [Pseudoalteromonas aurantia]MBE0366404.1 hypothetical protein [Pseudoalteromonas aurantia 208]